MRLPFDIASVVASPAETQRFCRDVRAARQDAGVPRALLDWLKDEEVATVDLSAGFGVEVHDDQVVVFWKTLHLVLDGSDREVASIDAALFRRLEQQSFTVQQSDKSRFAHSLSRQSRAQSEVVRIGNLVNVPGRSFGKVAAEVVWRHSIAAKKLRITYRDVIKDEPRLALPTTATVRVPDAFVDALAAKPLRHVELMGYPNWHGLKLIVDEGIAVRSDLESTLERAKFVQRPNDETRHPGGAEWFLQGPSNANCQVKIWVADTRLNVLIWNQLPDPTK
jgi:hypothetical protein